jgi:hypothetical protein
MNSLNWLLLFGLLSLFINALYAQSETSEDSEDSTGEDSGDVTTAAADSSSGTCDYILYFPSGTCIRSGETGSGSSSYTCATASTVSLMSYTSDDCSGTAAGTTTLDSSSGLTFSCGTGVTCDSFSVTVSSNSTTCSDPMTFDYVAECVAYGDVLSTMASCDGGSVSITSYASADCSGVEISGEFTDDCSVTCSGSANTISVVMGFCVMLIGLIWSLH